MVINHQIDENGQEATSVPLRMINHSSRFVPSQLRASLACRAI